MDSQRTELIDCMKAERLLARGFVIAGGVFWSFVSIAGLFLPGAAKSTSLVLIAIWPLLATLVALIVGWYFERTAAVLLFAGSAGLVIWGAAAGWSLGFFSAVATLVALPMATAASFFLLASQDQATCERMGAAQGERVPTS